MSDSEVSITIDCANGQLYFPKWKIIANSEPSYLNMGETPLAHYRIKISKSTACKLSWFVNASVVNNSQFPVKINKVILLLSKTNNGDTKVIENHDVTAFLLSSATLAGGETKEMNPVIKTTIINQIVVGDVFSASLMIDYSLVPAPSVPLAGTKQARTECEYPVTTISGTEDDRIYYLFSEAKGQDGVSIPGEIKEVVGAAVCQCLKPVSDAIRKIGSFKLSSGGDISFCPKCFANNEMELLMKVISPTSPNLVISSVLTMAVKENRDAEPSSGLYMSPGAVTAKTETSSDKAIIPSPRSCDQIKSLPCSLSINTINPKVRVISEVRSAKSPYLAHSSIVDHTGIEYHTKLNFADSDVSYLQLRVALTAAPGQYSLAVYRQRERDESQPLVSPTPITASLLETEDESNSIKLKIPYHSLKDIDQLFIIVTKDNGANLLVHDLIVPGEEIVLSYLSGSLNIHKYDINILESYYDEDADKIAKVNDLLSGKQAIFAGSRIRLLTNEEFSLLYEYGLHYKVNLSTAHYQGDILVKNTMSVKICPENGSASQVNIGDLGHITSQSRGDIVKFPKNTSLIEAGRKIGGVSKPKY